MITVTIFFRNVYSAKTNVKVSKRKIIFIKRFVYSSIKIRISFYVQGNRLEKIDKFVYITDNWNI